MIRVYLRVEPWYPGGMLNVSTQTLIQLTIQHLSNLGHTNVQSTQRWEGDGVFHVWSDQSSHAWETIPHNINGEIKEIEVRYGWTLDLCGNDNEFYPCGIAFSYVPKRPQEENYVEVESWDHLTQLINSHPHS